MVPDEVEVGQQRGLKKAEKENSKGSARARGILRQRRRRLEAGGGEKKKPPTAYPPPLRNITRRLDVLLYGLGWG